MPPESQRRVIQIRVDAGASTTQLKQIASSMGDVSKSTKKMASDLGFLTSAFSLFTGYFGVSQIISFSDEMQNLSNRLVLLTGSQEGAAATLQSLLKLSDRTNTSIADLSQTYTRLSVSMQGVNATSEEMIAFVEVLTNTFRIAGATTAETQSTIIQLSQAFSSGTLRGQELRSVMLQNATVAGLLREKFGKNLLKDAEAGLIRASSVLEVLYNNQEKINESATKLKPTFEQTFVKTLGRVKFEIGELNQRFDLSAKFADLMSSAIKNLGFIAGTVGALAIPLVTASLISMGTSLLTVNPYVVIFTGAIALGVLSLNYFGSETDTVTQKFYKLKAGLLDNLASILEWRNGVDKAVLSATNFFGINDKLINQTDLNYGFTVGLRQQEAEARKLANSVELTPEQKFKDELKSLVDKLKAIDATNSEQAKAKNLLADLNKEYLFGTLTVSDYNDRLAGIELTKVNQEFVEGKKDLDAYTAALNVIEGKQLSKQFTEGAISLQEFNDSIKIEKIDTLNAKLAEGSISLIQYNDELTKVSDKLGAGGVFAVGTQRYLDSLGTTANQTADAIKTAFGALETSFLGFIKTGKFEFSKFAEAVLDDLLKIVIRASILQPLAQGLTGLFTAAPTGAAGGAYTQVPSNAGFAKGGAFGGGNVIPFARGGLVNSPTLFGYGSGKNGIMGEAGPEAILPLSRGKGGNLGVQASVTPVTVNIINNTPSEVQTRETTGPSGDRQIEILIASKVKEGIGSGVYDRALSQSYGLQRRGS